jgi:hypothetical protein
LKNVVAYTTGLERARWLEVIEFEEDSTSAI